MSGNFDPIDDWLGRDVELLPPRPGTFERVHRRARRRKATVAMSAAAGVAAAVVAAAVLPMVASALLPGHGGGNQADVGGAKPSHRVSPGPSASHRGQTSSPPHVPTYLAGSGLSIASTGSPAAPGFEPTSVTFYNVRPGAGAALGTTTSGCRARACTTLAGTQDYGATWSKADAPPAGPPDGDSGVSQVRFLSPKDGWAYGPQLFSTQDGGATWTRDRGLHGRVIDLATVGDSAYAVVASCSGTGRNFATGCSSFTLYSSPSEASDWTPVAGASGDFPVTPGGLQLTKPSGYLLAGPALFVGSASGGSWQRATVKSGLVPECLDGKGQVASGGASGLLTPDPSGILYLLCQEDTGSGPTLYQSSDAGQTWQLTGRPTIQGTATSMAVGSAGGTLVVATDSGIYYSTDARTWHRASLGDQAPGGFSFVGMTDGIEGVAVPANPALKEIFLTSDGGKTWHPKTI